MGDYHIIYIYVYMYIYIYIYIGSILLGFRLRGLVPRDFRRLHFDAQDYIGIDIVGEDMLYWKIT